MKNIINIISNYDNGCLGCVFNQEKYNIIVNSTYCSYSNCIESFDLHDKKGFWYKNQEISQSEFAKILSNIEINKIVGKNLFDIKYFNRYNNGDTNVIIDEVPLIDEDTFSNPNNKGYFNLFSNNTSGIYNILCTNIENDYISLFNFNCTNVYGFFNKDIHSDNVCFMIGNKLISFDKYNHYNNIVLSQYNHIIKCISLGLMKKFEIKDYIEIFYNQLKEFFD